MYETKEYASQIRVSSQEARSDGLKYAKEHARQKLLDVIADKISDGNIYTIRITERMEEACSQYRTASWSDRCDYMVSFHAEITRVEQVQHRMLMPPRPEDMEVKALGRAAVAEVKYRAKRWFRMKILGKDY